VLVRIVVAVAFVVCVNLHRLLSQLGEKVIEFHVSFALWSFMRRQGEVKLSLFLFVRRFHHRVFFFFVVVVFLKT
jgi:hypothetical protein